MSLLNTIKSIASETGNANVSTAFMFGTVTAIAPLTIYVDSRFYISEPSLVVMKELRSGEYKTHNHTILSHVHGLSEHATEAFDGHEHNIPLQETEGTDLVTAQEIYLGLLIGDKVVLLRNQGGQRFLILGRV